MKKFAVTAFLLISFAPPALAAEFYLARDTTTKKCKVLPTKPDGETMIMIGQKAYATRDEARAAKKSTPECQLNDPN